MLNQDGALMPSLLGKQGTGALPHFSALDQPATGTVNVALSAAVCCEEYSEIGLRWIFTSIWKPVFLIF